MPKRNPPTRGTYTKPGAAIRRALAGKGAQHTAKAKASLKEAVKTEQDTAQKAKLRAIHEFALRRV